MRAALVSSLVVACGAPAPAPPEAPAGSLLDCTRVADHVAKTAHAARPRPGMTHEAIHSLVATRCKADGWSDESKQCLVATTTIAEARACEATMTDAQRTAIRTAARGLRKDGPVEPDDQESDWVRHVVEEPAK